MSEFYTERMLMRPFVEADIDAFVDLKTHPENMAGTHAGSFDPKQACALLEAYLTQWRQSAIGMWALLDINTETFIGECGFAERPGFEGLTLRYTLDRKWWGRKLAQESVNGALAYGRRHESLNRVSALAMDSNTRSCRILEQVGMQHVEDDFAGTPGFRRYVLSLKG